MTTNLGWTAQGGDRGELQRRSPCVKGVPLPVKCLPFIFKDSLKAGEEMHTFNPSTWEPAQADLCELEISLVYTARSRAARAT